MDDIQAIGNYLYITDLNNGIFVAHLHNNTTEIVAESCYLYTLTSGPNKMKVENVNQNEYQILVDTIAKNELIIFEPISRETNFSAD